jgi:vacuolar-type H+-ATPase subunit I/STV1
LKLSTARIEVLVWVLIYGGLLVCGIGIALSRGGRSYGWGFVAAGLAAAAVGALLIWWRSRIVDTPEA